MTTEVNPNHAGCVYALHSSQIYMDTSQKYVFTTRMGNSVDPDQLAS